MTNGLARVVDQLADKALTPKVSSGAVTAAVLDAERGKFECAMLCSSQQQFLDEWTPNGKLEYGMSNTYWEIYNYLGVVTPIWISRVPRNNWRYGGVKIRNKEKFVDSSLTTSFQSKVINEVIVDKDLFESKITETKDANFKYDSSTGSWFLDDTQVNIINYGVSYKFLHSETHEVESSNIAEVTVNKELLAEKLNTGDYQFKYFAVERLWKQGKFPVNLDSYGIVPTWAEGSTSPADGDTITVHFTKNVIPNNGDIISVKYTAPQNGNVKVEYVDLDEISWDANDLFMLVGATPGGWHDKLSVTVETKNPKVENTFTLGIYWDGKQVDTKVVSFDKNVQDGYGVPCYISTALKDDVNIQVILNPAIEFTSDLEPVRQINPIKFGESYKGDVPSDSNYIQALSNLSNLNAVKFQYIADGGFTSKAYHNYLLQLCHNRLESSYAFLSVPIDKLQGTNKRNNTLDYRKNVLAANTYCGELIGEWIPYLDTFNNREIYLSPSLVIAANCAKMANTYGFIKPAFGPNYGLIPILSNNDLFAQWTPDEAGILCDNQINPIIKDPDVGVAIWDQKTLQVKDSPLSERAIATTINLKFRPDLRSLLKFYIAEINDEETWKLVQDNVDFYGRIAYSNREVYDWLAKCDSENNTALTVRQRQLVVDFAVQMREAVKWIILRTVVSPYGSNLSEMV